MTRRSGRCSARGAKAASQERDSGSAQWASSRTRATGARCTTRWVRTQSSPSRRPCGSGGAPCSAAQRPRAGPTMEYQLPRASRSSASEVPASWGWMSWRATWKGWLCSCSPPRAARTVQALAWARRRTSDRSVVLPRPAGPEKASRAPPASGPGSVSWSRASSTAPSSVSRSNIVRRLRVRRSVMAGTPRPVRGFSVRPRTRPGRLVGQIKLIFFREAPDCASPSAQT